MAHSRTVFPYRAHSLKVLHGWEYLVFVQQLQQFFVIPFFYTPAFFFQLVVFAANCLSHNACCRCLGNPLLDTGYCLVAA